MFIRCVPGSHHVRARKGIGDSEKPARWAARGSRMEGEAGEPRWWCDTRGFVNPNVDSLPSILGAVKNFRSVKRDR